MDTQTLEAPAAEPVNPPAQAVPATVVTPFYRNKLVIAGAIVAAVILLLGAFVAGLAVGSAVASGAANSRIVGPGGPGGFPQDRDGTGNGTAPGQGGPGNGPRGGNQNGNQNGPPQNNG